MQQLSGEASEFLLRRDHPNDNLDSSYFRGLAPTPTAREDEKDLASPPPSPARSPYQTTTTTTAARSTSVEERSPSRSALKALMSGGKENEAPEVESYHPRQHKRPVYTLFACLVLGQVFLNYDSGAIPSVLPIIGADFDLNTTLLGLLGALPYIGLVVASPFVGTALQKYSQKTVLSLTIACNTVATVMLTVSINRALLFTSKLLMGISQAAYFIYLPVWVDEFAPQDHITLWMGIVQGSVVFGVMIGYLITGFIRPWQYSIIVEDVALLALCALLLATPRKYVDLYDAGEAAPVNLSTLETSPTASHERLSEGVKKFSEDGVITLSTEGDQDGDATGSTAAAAAAGASSNIFKSGYTEGVGRLRSKVGSQTSSLDIEATDGVIRMLQSQHQRKLANYHKLRMYSVSSELPWHDIATNLPPHHPSNFTDQPGGVSPKASGVSRLWSRSSASPSIGPRPHREGGRIGTSSGDAFVGRSTLFPRGVSKGSDMEAGPEVIQNGIQMSTSPNPAVASGRRKLKHVLAQRAPAIVVPSPCGAVMNSLDVVAGFDDPALIVNTKGMEARRKDTGLIARGEPPSSRLPVLTEERPEVGSKITGFIPSLKCLMRNGVYYYTVLTLCALFYVVTGLQYWATTYFITAKHIPENRVRVIFSATAATAPALGVLVGAVSVDYLGGYRSTRGMFRALIFTASTGLAASLCGVAASFLGPFGWIMAMIWLQMFLGGTILPAATGILIASVDPCIRPFASSFSMFLYNILGYSLGTFLPGPFMAAFGVETGMKIVFFWSFFGVIFIFMAIISAWRSHMVVTDISCATGEDPNQFVVAA